jgi:peptidoglycan-associated lipoprotein
LVLDELYALLLEFATMKIELSSHTDCRATTEYNQDLSQRRAESAVEYLVSKGINKSRMDAVGYGESKLLNHCSDGVNCSEEEHQQNRRTEFKIIEF